MELKYEAKNAWKVHKENNTLQEVMDYSKGYIDFLNKSKTERDCTKEIIKQATLRAEQKETEIIANAKEEASQLKEKASKDVEQERQKVMNEIKNEISNIAVLAASKVIEKDIDSNKHKELIDNFIKEVGESK